MTASLIHNLFSTPVVLSAYLSPDGHQIAFTWQRRHPNLDVFLVPADGSAPPLALTDTGQATSFVSWAPDSTALVVAQDHDGDERDRLYRVQIDRPCILQPLTEDYPPYFVRGGSLSPDGRSLYYGANFDFSSGQVIEPTWIYRHDLQTHQRAALARPQRPAQGMPVLNLQGTHLLYPRKDLHPEGRQFHLVDVIGQQDRQILNFGERVKVFARWLPDGQRILTLCEARDAGDQLYMALGIYHWPSGKLRWLIDDPQHSIESAWVSPNGLVILDEMEQATHRATLLDIDSGRQTPFPRLPGNLLPIGQAAGGGWIGIYYAANRPAEIVRFKLDARTPQDLHSLTRLSEIAPLDLDQLSPAESFHWAGSDGLQIQGWLYRAHPNPRRAILYLHGGPSSHSEDRFNAQIQYFVARGFNVLDVNYRGSTGFGLQFREKIKEDGWGGREQGDIAAGARALMAAGLAEPGRVGVTGASYGGYCAWYLITHFPPDIIAAAAPVCGMTDLAVDYRTTRPDLRPLSIEMMGGSPEEAPDRYFQRSPIHFVHNICGRLLIVQGARDPNVTLENLRLVAGALKKYQIPHEVMVFEDEGHGIQKPHNQQALAIRLADFFDAALKPD